MMSELEFLKEASQELLLITQSLRSHICDEGMFTGKSAPESQERLEFEYKWLLRLEKHRRKVSDRVVMLENPAEPLEGLFG